MTTSITPLPTAQDFFSRFQQIGADFIALAEDYLNAVQTRPLLRMELLEVGFSEEQLRKLEALARGQLHPKLMLVVGTQYRALARCPRSVQEQVIAGGVTVLEPDGKDTRIIPLDDLTPQQSRQVFRDGTILSITQQKTYLAQLTPKPAPADVLIKKNKVIYNGVTITKSQMLQWLAEMK